ncbi:MAG: GDP-mannose 4,6-dehydratase, partial [Candidatus Adiutrix sp.]
QHSVREFIEKAAAVLGLTLNWAGEGVNETGCVANFDPAVLLQLIKAHHGETASPNENVLGKNMIKRLGANPALKLGTPIVRIDPRYFRPTEVETLLGDAAKAKERLGWQPETTFDELVKEMVEEDFMTARRDSLCMDAGFEIHEVRE